jgi:hypothetical protein
MSWLLIPLVLFLPGYAIAALAFPPRTISPAERGIYAIAISIAVAAVGGLILQLAIGLDRAGWAVLLGSVTLICAGWAVRLGRLRKPRPPRLPWALPFAVAAFAAAGLVAGMAIVSARDGQLESRARIHFTDFWIAPPRPAADAPPAGTFLVGLRSHESEASRYILRLARGGLLLAEREAVLRPGEQRVWDFSTPAGPGPLVASVRQDGGPPRRLHLPLEG